ncbi:hypothetical protein [Frigidibacter sp. ROC022]|uniref:hypothetical protein n=1 Tax=Frigidibacter sp. ROC022 TaxID=2971796 RepID=UPI00215B3749|nr:hypothetical protein [Frigidibacter sp. ROC022]MCR8724075.1 hypothetical protein [Frigidibacter sp. ROC022]
MLTRRRTLAGLVFVAGLAARPAAASSWRILGRCKLDLAQEADRIEVGPGRGRCTTLRLQVAGAAVRFERLVIRFGNGDSIEVPLGDLVPAGGRSRAIDMPGSRRRIQAVEMAYRGAGAGDQAEVTLLGL